MLFTQQNDGRREAGGMRYVYRVTDAIDRPLMAIATAVEVLLVHGMTTLKLAPVVLIVGLVIKAFASRALGAIGMEW